MNLQGLKVNMDGKDYQVTRVSGDGHHGFLDITLTHVNADSNIVMLKQVEWSQMYGLTIREPGIYLTNELVTALEYVNQCRGV